MKVHHRPVATFFAVVVGVRWTAGGPAPVVELGAVGQRHRAVCEVLVGATVVDVARRNGVVRQTVHDWLRAYARSGLAGLADRRPQAPVVSQRWRRP